MPPFSFFLSLSAVISCMTGTGGMGNVFQISIFCVFKVTYSGIYLPIMAVSSLIVMIYVMQQCNLHQKNISKDNIRIFMEKFCVLLCLFNTINNLKQCLVYLKW